MNGRTNSTSTGEELIQIPLDPVETFVTSAYNGYVEITWDDPVDKYATPEGEVAQDPQQLVSKWSYTTIVKKKGSDPTGPKDGIPVVNSNIRDQYKSTPFTDTNVVNNTEYHYAAFAINEDEVSSDGVYQIAIPKAYSLVLAENTWEQINDVANEGIAASVWDIGDTKDVLVSNMKLYPSVIEDVTIPFAIIGFDVMDKSDGTGKAPITFIAMTITEDWLGSNRQDAVNYYDFPIFDKIQNTLPTQLPSELLTVVPEVITHVITATKHIANTAPAYEYPTYDSYTFNFTPRNVFGDDWQECVHGNITPNGFEIQNEYPQFPYFVTISNRINYDYYGYYSGDGSNVAWAFASSFVDYINEGSYRDPYVAWFGIHHNDGNNIYDSISMGFSTDAYARPGFCVGKSSV